MPVICPRCCGLGVFVEQVEDDRSILEWDCLYCGHVYYTDSAGNKLVSYCTPSYEETCGANLKAERLARHLSLAHLASLSNLSVRYLSRVEHGDARLGLKTITGLAKAFGMEMDQLAMKLMKGVAA